MRNLKNLRLSRGLSQQVVADYLDVTRQAYSNYENGNRTPDYEVLLKLAEFFDTTLDDLLRGDDKKSPSPYDGDGRVEEFITLFGKLTQTEQKLIIDQIKGILAGRE